MARNKTILTLGYDIPNNDNNINQNWAYLEDRMSLSDYDIVVIKPIVYKVNNTIDSIKYWRHEFKEFVENGGLLFVLLYKNESIQVNNGIRLSTISNYSIIPSVDLEFVNTNGNVLIPKMPIINKLFSTFKEAMKYKVQITGDITPTFISRDGKKVLGTIQTLGKGHIVYLPYINLYDLYGEDFEEDDEQYLEIELKAGHKLITCLKEICALLQSSESIAPEWLNREEYFTRRYAEIQNYISAAEKQIAELQERKDSLQISLDEEHGLSALLYETGKPLEHAVSKALKILGYTQAENYNDGRLELDQVIISPEGDRFIGECEGKDNTAINIDKFRQLNDSLYEDFQREEIQVKAYGIIFGNPQRLLEPEKRTLFFTEKCVNNAKREGVGLIKTIDLFYAAKHVADTGDTDYARRCRQAIKEQLGQVVVFPKD